MIRILIADDHQMFIDGLKALLDGHDTCKVIGQAVNGMQVLEFLEKEKADLVLMDVNMSEMDGITATRELKKKHPHIKVLMLTMFTSKDYIEKVLKAGADGYILKNTGKDELNTAIETLISGKSYFTPEVTKKIMEGLQGKKTVENDPMLVELTEREKDVLRLIIQGMTTNEIADKLCISFHTVESHRRNLISKLPVKNSAGLVKYAVDHNLV
jgi:DNA-binding NarL/FixJ family response regulator